MKHDAEAPRGRPSNDPGRTIYDPAYRYNESRNPYWKKLRELPARVVYADNDTEIGKGRWRELFQDAESASPRRPLHVEVGCNGGHVTLEWAKRDSAAGYIGLDWKMKQIHRGAEKAIARGIRNLLFFRAHAERIPFMFGEGEIDHLYLYFPDPWPKKSQWKNRFFNEKHLATLAPVVRSGGSFHVKTDHPGYFEWMLEVLPRVEHLWEVREKTHDLHAGNPDPQKLEIPDVTLFEKLFIKDGLPIHSLRLLRK